MYSQLDEMSHEDFLNCLTKYNENYSFVEWARINAPSIQFYHLIFQFYNFRPVKLSSTLLETKDLPSLKLLAEFASESENENEGALDVVRVQSFQLVGTCYSPLIYDLKTDSSYDQLMEHLKKVHQNLKKNPKLPEKIVNNFFFCNYR